MEMNNKSDLDSLIKKLDVYNQETSDLLKKFVDDHKIKSDNLWNLLHDFKDKTDSIFSEQCESMIYKDKNNWKVHAEKIKSYLKHNVDLLLILLDKKLIPENKSRLESLKKSIDKFDDVKFFKLVWHFIKNLVFIFTEHARFNLKNLRMSLAFDEFFKNIYELTEHNNKILGRPVRKPEFKSKLTNILGGPFECYKELREDSKGEGRV